MRRSLTESLLLYGTVAVLVLAVMLTVVIPAITNLGDVLQAGAAPCCSAQTSWPSGATPRQDRVRPARRAYWVARNRESRAACLERH